MKRILLPFRPNRDLEKGNMSAMSGNCCFVHECCEVVES